MISAAEAKKRVELLDDESYEKSKADVMEKIIDAIKEQKYSVDFKIKIARKVLKELREKGYEVLEIPEKGGTRYKISWDLKQKV